ncbi:MAG: hypothetical protein ACK4KW_05390 [Gemmobacter sp.]
MGQRISAMLAPLPAGARAIAEERLRELGFLRADQRLEAAFEGMPGCVMGGLGCGMDCGFGCETSLDRMLAMATSERAQANAVLALHRRMQGSFG